MTSPVSLKKMIFILRKYRISSGRKIKNNKKSLFLQKSSNDSLCFSGDVY